MPPPFGHIRQLGYIVHDLDAALRHWVEVQGVGPFYRIDRVDPEQFEHRGVPGSAPFAVALANSGPMQVELIQPLDDAPSMWREFLDAGHEGLQHVAYWTTDFDADLDRARRSGLQVGHRGCVSGGRFVYFDTTGHPGTVIELSEQTGEKAAAFALVRAAAEGWDGADPIRTIPAGDPPTGRSTTGEEHS